MSKHVRFVNNTTDVTSARLIFLHHGSPPQVCLDAFKNGENRYSSPSLTFGHRGMIIYNNSNQRILAHGEIEYSSSLPRIFISINGDAQGGYIIAPGADP